jgi:hypothetical protein
MPGAFIPSPDAVDTVQELGKPGLRPAADAIASTIPAYVPVHHGVMQRLYKTTVVEQEKAARVYVGSPFWHWLEYGTQYNAAYRPVESAVHAVGLRYEAH